MHSEAPPVQEELPVESDAPPVPVDQGGTVVTGGAIAALRAFNRQLGETVSALQNVAEKAEAARGALEKARKAEAESTVALQGAASTNQAGATSGGPSTPDGGRGVQTDPLSKMKDQILQGIGRK